MTQILFVGLGYCAAEIARRLDRNTWAIAATSRSAEGEAAILRQGYRAFRFLPGIGVAALREHPSPVLEGLTHILVSAPPEGTGDPLLEAHMADLALAPDLRWIGYLSTIGVYGDQQGAWVDETTEPRPATERARRRMAAEDNWIGFGRRTGRTVTVFRLPGIYGPGRSALDQIRAGTARRIVKPGQVFNRIHVADIATAVLAAIAGDVGGIFNVTDDDPSPSQDVIAYAAALLGEPVPPEIPFETAQMSDMARSFYGTSKRVSNALMKAQLGVRLAYPTYRDGLAALAGKRLCQSD